MLHKTLFAKHETEGYMKPTSRLAQNFVTARTLKGLKGVEGGQADQQLNLQLKPESSRLARSNHNPIRRESAGEEATEVVTFNRHPLS